MTVPLYTCEYTFFHYIIFYKMKSIVVYNLNVEKHFFVCDLSVYYYVKDSSIYAFGNEVTQYGNAPCAIVKI